MSNEERNVRKTLRQGESGSKDDGKQDRKEKQKRKEDNEGSEGRSERKDGSVRKGSKR